MSHLEIYIYTSNYTEFEQLYPVAVFKIPHRSQPPKLWHERGLFFLPLTPMSLANRVVDNSFATIYLSPIYITNAASPLSDVSTGVLEV